jgi:seryl-tRNA synthetase
MLTLSQLRDQREQTLAALAKRNLSAELMAVVDKVLQEDDERRSSQLQRDGLLAQVNTLSKEIGMHMQKGDREIAEALRTQVAEIKEQAKALDARNEAAEGTIESLLLQLPNAPHASVPVGTTPEENEVFQAWEGELPKLYDGAMPHWELAKKYPIFDLEAGVKLTGAGFPVYRGKGAKLQRALITYFLDKASEAGFEEFQVPHMVNEASARGTGQLPDKEGQMYHCQLDDLYLIPTAEVPLTNLMRNEIVAEADLPIKMAGYTPCFRREAGSYGAHVRGLNRVHQFDKVEIVVVEHPSRSYETLMLMLDHVKVLLEELELPYRILRLCGGDMGFTSALTYDFEVWSAAQERWLEVSSVSNFETYQSNRLKLRYRDANGKNQLAHTLNGSALALPRILASILENHQTAEGIRIPKALQPYTGFDILN